MPRNSRKKAPVETLETPASEPTPITEILEKSPAMATFRAAQDAKSLIDPEREMPESPTPEEDVVAAFQRQRAREQAVTEPERSHVQRLAEPKGLRPVPTGFKGLEGHYAAGIRLTRSLDKNIVGLQFADNWRPSRDGLNPETQRLGDRGFKYRPERTQWERVDREWPAENYQDAKKLVEALASERLAEAGAGMGRS